MNPLWQRAVLLFGQQRWELAEQACREILLEHPEDADALRLLALCLCEREQYDEATRAARQAVALAPDDAASHHALAVVMFQRRHYAEAGHSVGESLRLNPERPHAWALLAQVNLCQERWKEALEAAERGLQFDPENADCLNLKAMCLNKLGRPALASETLRGALSREPDNALTHANLGWTHLERGAYREALDSFREALRIDPTMEHARRGILEAIKARNPVYRLALRYVLWMGRLQEGARWGVIVGAYFGYRLVSNMGRHVPALAPYTGAIVAVYVSFVLLTWLADPLFNLLMRLHPDGKYALSRSQIVQANWVGGLLAVALPSLIVYLSTGLVTARCLALVGGFLIPPVLGALASDVGKPRNVMIAISVALFLLGMAGTAVVLLAETAPGLVTEPLESLARFCWSVFPVAALAAQFAAPYFANQTVRR